MKDINITINISLTAADETNPNEIERLIRDLLAQPNVLHSSNPHPEGNNLLLSEYMKANLNVEQLKPSTIDNRHSTIMWVVRLFPELRIKDIPTDFIEQFCERLRINGLSTNTIVKHVSHLRIFILKAARKGLVDSCWLNTSHYSLKRTPFKHTFLSPEELELVESQDMNALRDVGRMIVGAFLFCCYTGLRYSDAAQLQHKHLEWCDDECWINLCMKKTGNPIRLPLSKLFAGKGMRIVEERSRLPHTQDTHLFPMKSNEYANHVLKRMSSRLGISKHVTFHASRHTFATLCLKSGVKLEVIQALLGHHSIRTTQIYAKMTSQMVVDSLKDIHW